MRGALSRVMTERDMAVIISLTGESEATVSLARELRLRQVPTLSITRLGNNTLASVCDENLYIHSITLPARYGVEYEISTPLFYSDRISVSGIPGVPETPVGLPVNL